MLTSAMLADRQRGFAGLGTESDRRPRVVRAKVLSPSEVQVVGNSATLGMGDKLNVCLAELQRELSLVFDLSSLGRAPWRGAPIQVSS